MYIGGAPISTATLHGDGESDAAPISMAAAWIHTAHIELPFLFWLLSMAPALPSVCSCSSDPCTAQHPRSLGIPSLIYRPYIDGEHPSPRHPFPTCHKTYGSTDCVQSMCSRHPGEEPQDDHLHVPGYQASNAPSLLSAFLGTTTAMEKAGLQFDIHACCLFLPAQRAVTHLRHLRQLPRTARRQPGPVQKCNIMSLVEK